jgi:hypothetical protein
MQWLKQSTAATVKVGPFIDSTDGDTAEIGLTISQADVRLSKNGGNIAQKSEVSACTHDELGYYDCNLDTTDTGTLGRLQLMVHEAGALPVWHEYMVLSANVYDSLVAGSDLLQTDATQISGDGPAADNAEAFFDNTGFVASNSTIGTTTTNTDMRGTDSAALAATALTNVTWTDARAGYLDNINGHIAQTGDVFEVLTSAGGSATSNGAADGTTIVDSAQTGANDLYNSLAIKITSGLYKGQVRTIRDWDLGSTTFTLTRGFGGQIVTGVTYRVVSALVYQPGIALVPSASPIVEPDTLETISVAITTNAGAPSTGEITPGTITIARIRAGASTNIVTAAACSEAAGNIYYAYTYPAASWNEGDYYLATMSGQEIQVNGITYPLSTIPFRGYVTRESSILADTNELQTDDVPGLIGALNDPTAAVVADAVWDEAATGHTDAGKAGAQLWTDVDAILADTNELQADDIPGTLTTIEGKIDTVDGNVDAILVDTAALDTALADSIPADGTRPSPKQALYMIIQYLNEREVSGTTVTVKKADGSTSLYTLTLSDGSDPTSITRAS